MQKAERQGKGRRPRVRGIPTGRGLVAAATGNNWISRLVKGVALLLVDRLDRGCTPGSLGVACCVGRGVMARGIKDCAARQSPPTLECQGADVVLLVQRELVCALRFLLRFGAGFATGVALGAAASVLTGVSELPSLGVRATDGGAVRR